MKTFATIVAAGLLLSACNARGIQPPVNSTRLASSLARSVYTDHFVIPITAQTAILDPCMNPATAINGTDSGKYEFNEQFDAAGKLEIFHYQENSVFTSTDGSYTGRNSAGAPGIVNYVNGLAVANGHSTFKLNGPAGTLQIQEASHFTFAADGTPKITHVELKVLCGAK